MPRIPGGRLGGSEKVIPYFLKRRKRHAFKNDVKQEGREIGLELEYLKKKQGKN